jgi:hypothetical protein
MAMPGEFGSVVADDHHWAASASDQGIELTTHPGPRQRRVGNQRDTFPGEVVHDSQDAKPAAVRQRIADEVQ